MSIQVGANDGQTIDINLQKIDSSTLGLSGFNVQASSTLKTTAITSSFADSGTAIGAVDVSGLGAGAAASAAQFDDVTGKYYTTISGSATGSENGVYELTAAAGSSTLGTQVGSLLLVLVLLLRPKLVRQLTLLLRLRLWWVRV